MIGSRIAWGIDLGESAVRAVKLSVEKSGARILALDIVPRTGRAEGYAYVDKGEEIRGALSTLVSRNKIGMAPVALSAPGPGFDRFISLPAVNMRQVPQIVRYEARQQIPFPLDEVAWDYQLASERPIPGEGIEVALFAIKTQIIEETLGNLSVANLGVDIVSMSRLALYNLLKFDRQIDDGTLIVDVGAGSTDIVILAEGNFRVRSIPISGEAVTKMLQQKFGISYEEAEELKKKASQSKQPEKLFNVMRPTFERLLGEIHKTIGYYKQQFKTFKVERAFLVGESFKMQPLVALFAENLGCRVNVLSSFQRVSVGPEAAASPHAGNLSAFAVAIGLALQAAGQGPVTINVLPDEVRAQREIGRKKPFAIGIAACFGVGLLASFLNVMGDGSRLAELGGKPKATIDTYVGLGDAFREASDTYEIDRDVGVLSAIGRDRHIPLRTINEIATIFGTDEDRRVPVGIFLDEIRLETVYPEVKKSSADIFDEEPAEEKEPPEPVTKLTINGWSHETRQFVYEKVVAPLNSIDIFTVPKDDGLLWEKVYKPGEEEEKTRKNFTVIAVVTPRPAEAKGAED